MNELKSAVSLPDAQPVGAWRWAGNSDSSAENKSKIEKLKMMKIKKADKSLSAGTNDESSTNVQVEQVCQPIAKHNVMGSGLPIHATNKDNSFTFCGLKVTKGMSFHNGGIILGLIKGNINGIVCKECLSHCP